MTLAIEKDSLSGELYWYRGRSHYFLEEYPQAISDFNKAYSLGIENDTLLNLLGDSYIKEGKSNNGFMTFLLLRHRNSNFPHVHYQLAVCYQHLSRPNQAVKSLKQEISGDETYPASYPMIAGLLIEKGEFDSAIYFLNEGINVVEDPEVLSDLFYFRGISHFNKSQYAGALSDFETSNSHTMSYDKDLEMKIISTFVLLNKYTKALAVCDSILQIHPNDRELIQLKSTLKVDINALH